MQPTDTRTAAGPDGTGGDFPDGSADDPFGWDASYPVPENAYQRAEMLRWLTEELKRCDEEFKYPRLTAILTWMLRPDVGVVFALERQLADVELALTGRAPRARTGPC